MNKYKLFGMITISILLLAGVLLWVLSSKTGINGGVGIIAIIACGIAIFFLFIGFREIKNLKKGFTLEDERYRKIKVYINDLAFKLTMGWIIVLLIINATKVIDFDSDRSLSTLVVGIAILYVISWIVINRKTNFD